MTIIIKNSLTITVLLFCTFVVFGQNKTQKTDVLKQYTICNFNDGLKIKNVERLDEDSLRSRSVETENGQLEVTRIDSFYVLVGYPKMSPFANIRPERSQLVKDMFESDKKNVIAGMKYAISKSKEMETTEPVKSIVNGFDVYQQNRKSLYGSTLGITTLFNDFDYTITTIYIFNAEEKKRNFQTINELKKLRDNLVENYTKCINTNLGR
jgi:hypothetical protein